MELSFDEFLILAKRYQAIGSSSQVLLDNLRKGSYKEMDGVRLRQLFEFLRDIECFQEEENEVVDLVEAVEQILKEYSDEDEQIITKEQWVPEKGFPGATLWLQREDQRWTIAPTAQEGACMGKCVKDISPTKWFEKPLPLLVGGNR